MDPHEGLMFAVTVSETHSHNIMVVIRLTNKVENFALCEFKCSEQSAAVPVHDRTNIMYYITLLIRY